MDIKNSIISRETTARNLIRTVMSKDEKCRNDDKWLCLEIWRSQGIKVFFPYKDMKKMYNPETIIRNRAYIQNTEGSLLPTNPSVLLKRRIKEKVLRKFYVNNLQIISEWEKLKHNGN